MITYRPHELSDSPILITTADPELRSPADPEPVLTVQRAIKAHCILGGSVTLPTEHIVSDEVTSQAVVAMPELLKAGLLIPDLRAEFPAFGDFADKSLIHSARSLEKRAETAAFLEANTKRAVLYSDREISRAFARNLLRAMVLAKIRNRVEITWPALRQISEEWMTVPYMGTAERERCRRLITRGRSVFDQNAILIYHLLGGASTGSSPLLPEGMNSALGVLLESLNKNEISRENLSASINSNNRVDLMSILDAISPEETKFPIRKSGDKVTTAEAGQFALIELLDAFSIHSGVLDRLNDAQVAEISVSTEAKRARKTIAETYREAAEKQTASQILKLRSSDSAAVKADFQKKIREVIRTESVRTRRLSQVTSTIGWGSVALGVVTLPFTGGVGFAMSLGGVLLSASGSSLDSWNQLYSKPMLTLLEKIQSTGR